MLVQTCWWTEIRRSQGSQSACPYSCQASTAGCFQPVCASLEELCFIIIASAPVYISCSLMFTFEGYPVEGSSQVEEVHELSEEKESPITGICFSLPILTVHRAPQKAWTHLPHSVQNHTVLLITHSLTHTHTHSLSLSVSLSHTHCLFACVFLNHSLNTSRNMSTPGELTVKEHPKSVYDIWYEHYHLICTFTHISIRTIADSIVGQLLHPH